MKSTTFAVDVAKSVFEIAISHQPGKVAEHVRLPRSRFLDFFAQQRPATVILEACGSAHHWGRQLRAQGHRVRLLPPHTVRPYVPRNKTDQADAKGILEASRNEAIHPVPVKSLPQQTLASLHRIRSAWLSTRTSRLNTLRGVLREFGIAIPLGATRVVPRTFELLDSHDQAVPEALRPSLSEMCTEIRNLEQLVRGTERQMKALGRETPTVANLLTVPGIGILTATALVAFVGDVQRFPTGRHFASYLGLTPRESSSGLRRRLGAISKRGDSYLRMLLTHGARATICHAKKRASPDRLRAWALLLEHRRGHNKATIALANKMARIAWAVWKNGIEYTSVQAA